MMKSIAALWIVACAGSTHADKAPAEVRVEDRSVSIAWGPAVSDLRLGLSVDGTSVVFHLENVGKAKLEVWSHVATHERLPNRASLAEVAVWGPGQFSRANARPSASEPLALPITVSGEQAAVGGRSGTCR